MLVVTLHYPFSGLELSRFEAAGLTVISRERRPLAQRTSETWALAWVPHVRLAWPTNCLHPDDRLRIEGRDLAGEIFAMNGANALVELEGRHLDGGAGAIVELSPDTSQGPGLTKVNTSLTAYARCHLAWLRALTESWELHLAPVPDLCDAREQVAARFVDTVTELDGESPFWEELAFQMEDLGIPTGAGHEWVSGRDGLPDV